jgi:hypothetical protein
MVIPGSASPVDAAPRQDIITIGTRSWLRSGAGKFIGPSTMKDPFRNSIPTALNLYTAAQTASWQGTACRYASSGPAASIRGTAEFDHGYIRSLRVQLTTGEQRESLTLRFSAVGTSHVEPPAPADVVPNGSGYECTTPGTTATTACGSVGPGVVLTN